jgi:DNA-binding transcriptional LysR family regulator
LKLSNLDLNLMVVLDALLDEQNVTRAGNRVGLSQPAVSNALGRLRYILNDPILERDGRFMRLTERAHALKAPLRNLLDELARLLAEPSKFNPATTELQLRIFASDHMTYILLPELRRRLIELAPSAQLDIVWNDPSRVVELLEHGNVDVAIGRYDNTPSDIRREPLYIDDYVVLAHREHPVLKGDLDLERLLSYPRMAVSFEGRRYGYVERVIAQAGGKIDAEVVVSHLLAAPVLAAETDLLTITGGRLATRLQKHLPLASRPAPINSVGIPIEMIWHQHTDNDPALTWFRELLIEVCQVI